MNTNTNTNTNFAIAVKAGKFQAQEITYSKRGTSTVIPLSGWVKYCAALSYAPAGYKPYPAAYRFLD